MGAFRTQVPPRCCASGPSCAAALAEDKAGDCRIGHQTTKRLSGSRTGSGDAGFVQPLCFLPLHRHREKNSHPIRLRDRRLFSFTLTAKFSYNGSTASATPLPAIAFTTAAGTSPPAPPCRSRNSAYVPANSATAGLPRPSLPSSPAPHGDISLDRHFAPSVRWGPFSLFGSVPTSCCFSGPHRQSSDGRAAGPPSIIDLGTGLYWSKRRWDRIGSP